MGTMTPGCLSCLHGPKAVTESPCNSCEKGGGTHRSPLLWVAAVKEAPPAPVTTTTVSDGGSTSYYEVPTGATELNDLIEHKKMSFALGNIFKACYRLGEKNGTDAAYDVRKIIFFANRILKQLEKTNG